MISLCLKQLVFPRFVSTMPFVVSYDPKTCVAPIGHKDDHDWVHDKNLGPNIRKMLDARERIKG